MRPAPVGFQCPDDVAAGAPRGRAAGSTVNQLGGPSAPRQPVVTYALVALNVLAFVLEGLPLLGLPAEVNQFTYRFLQINALVASEPWRLLTAAFLHASVLHIGLNMVVLVLIGRQLEQVLGPVRYVVLYVVAALGGGVAVYLFNAPDQPVLGASGAIFGLFSAFYLVARRLEVNASNILATIGINLVLTLLIPRVSLFGHLGGLITGAVVGLIYTSLPSRSASARAVQLLAVAGVAVVLVILVSVRSAALS
jgi:membrane associated rhomboid family serine protease